MTLPNWSPKGAQKHYWIAYSLAYCIFYWIAHYIAYWIATHWFRVVKYSRTDPTVKPYVFGQTSLTRFGPISIDGFVI